ncbi:SRPBCC family protein [Streptomyces yanii]|uniref:SRPBCC family protein n=1 Tax=Streptomyces yanii TaxID=78510 RepID=UPI0031E559E8
MQAAPATAFGLLTDVTRWPDWVPGIAQADPGALDETFQVTFHGHRFEIFVGELVPLHRLGWSGVGAGVQLSQAWLLTAVEGGTHVVTENVVRGPGTQSLNTLSPLWASRLHTLWLAQLKRLSENAPEDGLA